MEDIFQVIIKGKNGMTLKNFYTTIKQLYVSIDEFCVFNGLNKDEINYEILRVKEGSICLEIKLPTVGIDKIIGTKILQDFVNLIEIRKKISELSLDISITKTNDVNKLEDEKGKFVLLNDYEFDLYTSSNKLDGAMSKLCKTIYDDPDHYSY